MILRLVLLCGFINLFAGNVDKIILGTEDWAPFSFKDVKTHKISGLSTEIIYGTLESMGVKVKSNKVLPWARTQNLAFAGKLDAVYTASINSERKNYMFFPNEPVVSSKWVLFIKKSNKDKLHFNSLEDLNGKKICLITGYNYPKLFKKYISNNSKITTVAKEELNIAKLLNGRCDYMPATLETTLNIVKTKPTLKQLNAYDNLYYFPKELEITNFYIMFSKKTIRKSFVDEFSKKLKQFKTTDEYKMILKKYL